MARLKDLVKTYRLLNDPKAPDWNVKFNAALFVAALAVVAFAAVAIQRDAETPVPTGSADAAAAHAEAGPRTEYVGADLEALDPAALPSDASLQRDLDRWHAENPGATVLASEPVVVGGRVVGYTIVYET